MEMLQERTALYGTKRIEYLLERKQVKNINLRIHKDCKIYVSANPKVPVDAVDDFVLDKEKYICEAQKNFRELETYSAQPKQYISGETFYLLGRGIRLCVEKSTKNSIMSDGIYLRLFIQNPTDFLKKQRMVTRYMDEQCKNVFGEIISEIYPIFQKYGVVSPTLRVRNMETQWGSCAPCRGIITLNKRLIEAPRNCIEYVVMHEFCHFIHPNHSKQFYSFLTMQMPDWKERKKVLDQDVVYGL